MEFDPKEHSAADRYRLLIGLITPRPIALVGTCASAGGDLNLAPFSFFNGCGSDPMTLLFCPANRDDGAEKDSLRNAKPPDEGGQGEFTVSLCSEGMLLRAVSCSEHLPYGDSEFVLSGLTQRQSKVVSPPGVAESPATFECRTLRVVRLNPGIAGGGNIVIGQVVHLHLEDAILDMRGRIDPARVRSVGRMGALDYCATRQLATIPFGRTALGTPEPFVNDP
ncbi:MAG: flavin reductase family protein [Phycisphaerales bacterium]|nr:flavin reductase family protein [Phycisphaerales bacterium]